MNKEKFNNLRIPNWVYENQMTQDGGQASTVIVKNNTTKEEGVFRVLKLDSKTKKEKEIEIKRFYRELGILNKYQHRNIVKILDHTTNKENQWYISKKGDSFKDFWSNYVKSETDANKVLDKAIKIIMDLADGLSELHDQGVVHRDIKFSNIVVGDHNEPILIDFGIAYTLGGERLSDIPIANKLGIDAAASLDGEVVPWLDVYLLSQLLIKMLCSNNKKQRGLDGPRDWRFMSYPGLSDFNRQIVFAITSNCYNINTSPSNAGQLKSLIKSLFYNKSISGTDDFRLRIEEIQNIIKHNKATSMITEADSISLVGSRLELLLIAVSSFTKEIKNLMKSLEKGFVISHQIPDPDGKLFRDKFYSETSAGLVKELCGDTNYVYLKKGDFELHCNWAIRLWTYDLAGENWLINVPHLEFGIYDPEGILSKRGFAAHNHLVLNVDGGVEVYSGNAELLRQSTIKDEIDLIRDNFLSVNIWSEISTKQ